VIRVLQEYADRGAAELAHRICEAAERFRDGSPAQDDQTVIVARLLDPAVNQRSSRRARREDADERRSEELAMAAA
jgi:hypothetical protein